MASWELVTNALRQWEWIGILLARLSVGTLFFLSGGGKLFVKARRKQMQDTLREAGVPAPAVAAILVSFVECSAGALLVIGFLTPFGCVALIAVMIVALATTVVPAIKTGSIAGWLGELLYRPETLYVVLLTWLFLSGPGWLSVDHVILSS